MHCVQCAGDVVDVPPIHSASHPSPDIRPVVNTDTGAQCTIRARFCLCAADALRTNAIQTVQRYLLYHTGVL